MLFISGPEIFVILIIVVMLFGAKNIPEIARGIGKGIRQVKDATNEIKREITDTTKEHTQENGGHLDMANDIKKEIDKVKDDLDDFTGPIKRQF